MVFSLLGEEKWCRGKGARGGMGSAQQPRAPYAAAVLCIHGAPPVQSRNKEKTPNVKHV